MMQEAGLAAKRVVTTAALVARAFARDRSSDPQSLAPVARARRNHAMARAMCEAHALEPYVAGEIPRGPAIFVANHVSYVDPLILAALVPAIGIAKAEVAAWPVLGARLRDLGVLFVRRGDAQSGARALRGAIAAIRAGASVLNFPEGTTTYGHDVLPFHRGMFGVARITGAQIVPVRVGYDDARVAWVGDETLLPHYVVLAQSRRIVVRVRFGRAIDPRTSRSAEELAARAREAIAAPLFSR
jgi:1-acyl-sn-glycerol-3-phosphate acyltransferase